MNQNFKSKLFSLQPYTAIKHRQKIRIHSFHTFNRKIKNIMWCPSSSLIVHDRKMLASSLPQPVTRQTNFILTPNTNVFRWQKFAPLINISTPWPTSALKNLKPALTSSFITKPSTSASCAQVSALTLKPILKKKIFAFRLPPSAHDLKSTRRKKTSASIFRQHALKSRSI